MRSTKRTQERYGIHQKNTRTAWYPPKEHMKGMENNTGNLPTPCHIHGTEGQYICSYEHYEGSRTGSSCHQQVRLLATSTFLLSVNLVTDPLRQRKSTLNVAHLFHSCMWLWNSPIVIPNGPKLQHLPKDTSHIRGLKVIFST